MCVPFSHARLPFFPDNTDRPDRLQRVSVAGRTVTTGEGAFRASFRRRDSSWELRTTDGGYETLRQGTVVKAMAVEFE